MDPALLPVDLGETAKQALQVMLPSAVICLQHARRATRQCLQGYVRASMKELLVALSPNIGLSAEHLLAQYEQMAPPVAYTCTTPEHNLDPAALDAPPVSTSCLQLAFHHECL